MKLAPVLLIATATPTLAELDAHEHGVGELNIAVDGTQVAMEFHAPGADIVGFEYEAESDTDKAAIEAGLAKLSKPLDLFEMPAAAGCEMTEMHVALESEEEHDDHGHDDDDDHDKDEDHAKDEHGHDDHGHDDHAEDTHDHDDHAEDKHDHDDHAEDEHAHDDHGEHADEANHTEFHAEYLMTCANPEAIDSINFAYFETFENALEVEVQIVTSSGASAFEVERDAPKLDLKGLF